MERSAWDKYKDPNVIYNVIRRLNFSFFSENVPTGIEKIDELIQNCVERKAAKRPSAEEAFKIMKSISLHC